jgi:hypothetical protein
MRDLIILIFTLYFLDEFKEDDISGHVEGMGEVRRTFFGRVTFIELATVILVTCRGGP